MRTVFCGKMPLSMVFLVCLSVYAKPETAARWRLLGLEDRSVNCILAIDTSMIFAGTSTGMSLYFNSKWYDLNVDLPVTSIAWFGATLFVGAGNGSRSDGVYIGKPIINGPPFYHLEVHRFFREPTAMVCDNTMDIPRLYVGGRNAVAVGMISKATIDYDTLFELIPVKTPEKPFGTTSPHCADMLLFDTANLYAGGYDDSAADQGSLITLVSDSFELLKSLDVTALARASFEEAGPQQLVVGTLNNGILLYNPSSQTSALLPSPGNQPINDIVTVPTMLWTDILVVACDSGVYTNNGRAQTWTRLGTIPARPRCIAQRGVISGVFLAGTDKGVYIYDDLPAHVDSRSVQKDLSGRTKWIFSTNGDIRIPIENNPASFATITVYTPSGKVHVRMPVAGRLATFRLETTGFCFYDCTVRGTVVQRGVVVYAQ